MNFKTSCFMNGFRRNVFEYSELIFYFYVKDHFYFPYFYFNEAFDQNLNCRHFVRFR